MNTIKHFWRTATLTGRIAVSFCLLLILALLAVACLVVEILIFLGVCLAIVVLIFVVTETWDALDRYNTYHKHKR